MSESVCPGCACQIDAAQTFCSNCGLKLRDLVTSADIDAYVRGRIVHELDRRLDGEERIAIAVAAAAEEKLWKSLTRVGGLIAGFILVVGAIFGYFGVKSFNDTVGGVAQSVTSAAKQVHAERDSIEQTATQSQALKKQLSGLSGEVASQAERVKTNDIEITQQLAALDKAEAAAEDGLKGELARAKKLSDQLAVTEHTLQTTVAQVAQQQDDVDIRKAYPGLGQPVYVVYNNQPWKGAADKKLGQKWLSLTILPDAFPKLSPATVTSLTELLKANNVVSFPFAFGTGGSMVSVFFPWEAVGNNVKPTLFYFRAGDGQSAVVIADLCAKALGFSVATMFSDPSTWSESLYGPERRQVISESGIDFQLLIKTVPDSGSVLH